MRLPRMVVGAIAVGIGVSAAALGISCSFPEIQYSAAAGAAGGGAATGTGGAATGTGGSGGTGGTASTGTGGSGDCTDEDNDGEISVACDGGTDCDDTDNQVHPGQTEYYGTPHPNVGFDYNCSGMPEPEFEAISCSGLACEAKTNVFLQDVACGATGSFGDCGLLCDITNLTVKLRECH
jgi:hypothetical protein